MYVFCLQKNLFLFNACLQISIWGPHSFLNSTILLCFVLQCFVTISESPFSINLDLLFVLLLPVSSISLTLKLPDVRCVMEHQAENREGKNIFLQIHMKRLFLPLVFNSSLHSAQQFMHTFTQSIHQSLCLRFIIAI